MKYLDNDIFYYEIIISKGKGKLTHKAELCLIKIAYNMIKKFENDYANKEDKYDCLQQGLLMMFQNWRSFDENKYDNPFPYFSEICKRGIADGLSQLYEVNRYEKWLRKKELYNIRKEKAKQRIC